MPFKSNEHSTRSVSLEIKLGSITLPILKLLNGETGFIARQLQNKIRQAPEFFRNAPVVIDLSELPDNESVDFFDLIDILHDHHLTPVGIRGGSPTLQAAAQDAKLAVLPEHKHENPALTATRAGSAPNPPPRAATTKLPSGSKLIEQPVRSGQRIYASGADLIILSQVSPGAEVMADGHIHIYGPLRGRALAGVQGNLEARIFCSDLQAELIAIGGHYKVSENLDESVRGKPVQVYLRDNSLIIENL
ncbi:putative septum site-determining protein MinC [Methylocaldum szegediense]|uniref:Probable septum site-determining protein MinC n=1 Tax=Methylocaldum szegediense TaxID=73780 RepID=A0ABM9I403_9GAMM|nr:putative septum site-determining protein MinC [Methylocaldum szegediense]